jgi:prepilin-type N-terminal cleavage/methylation domain-containing protein
VLWAARTAAWSRALSPPPATVARSTAVSAADGGFTLIEAVVALALIGLVTAWATSFHISSLRVTREQANRQVAAQMSSRALDTARKTGGAALLASPPSPVIVQVNGVAFTQQWTVTQCRQVSPGGDCATVAPAPGIAELVKVVVSVQWSDGGRILAQRTAALLSSAMSDPTFAS